VFKQILSHIVTVFDQVPKNWFGKVLYPVRSMIILKHDKEIHQE